MKNCCNLGKEKSMHGRIIFAVLVAAGLLSSAVPSAVAEKAKEFTLLTATIAEGANIWLPSTVVVNKGDQVKLSLRNVSKMEHGFGIDELGIQVVVLPGETKEVTFKPGSTGVFRYYCPLHKGHVGGQLIVQ
jgi:plastocyanin